MDRREQERHIQTVSLLILAATAVAFALYWLSPVMVPFTVALLLAFALSPVAEFQMRSWRFPRPLAVGTTMLLGLILVATLGLLGSMSMKQLTSNADLYQKRLEELAERVEESLPLEKWGVIPPTDVDAEADKEPSRASDGPAMEAAPDDSVSPKLPKSRGLSDTVTDALPSTMRNLLMRTADAVVSILSQGIIVMVFLMFLLIGDGTVPRGQGKLVRQASTLVKRYVAVEVFLSALTGLLVGVALWLMGVEMAMTFGFLAFVLNFIPTIGCFIATVLPVPLVLLGDDGSIGMVVAVVLVTGSIQFVIGNFVVPRMLGHSMNLNPITVLMALIFWATLWGIIGAFVAVPLTAVVRILLDKNEYTRPVANLMSGKPTPRERAEPAG
jgi:AI-2 transport protein TqsA